MSNRITAPVTDDLLAELISTEETLLTIDDPNTRLNDKAHYGPTVLQLEALAKAVLSAQASGSLLAPQTAGARFHVQQGSSVTRSMDEVVKYLTNEAPALLRHNGGALSQYHKDHTLHARNLLSELRSQILGSVKSQANSDLGLIFSTGAQLLVATAAVVAKIAAGDADGVKAEADEGRCTVMMDGGYRCTKAAGHRPPGSDDPHTPN